ncbi:hypothetical protein O6H91_12G042500 [Diphasiastrum complanatum]|uniref:Uncharacterized protein n=4 Tax=Diphasiastrum complanatum TaxID=34168 RepID=A0ACC2C0Z3_DIPCM|nr:hypothetical protein O6H91_12G042500 [Diphasiastrum complanatum]KAJ7535680.1 hypothetical protein O6H91_12G042500 [Diphasiastrum complanatum]KAJ7535681.1 hypothetical protein O6H91_12G042500 [Diphasiastrum complanatum]KAJ7535682.1 hypothetical protein O6H91_12G042500 [Diphasiastrum complanatum]
MMALVTIAAAAAGGASLHSVSKSPQNFVGSRSLLLPPPLRCDAASSHCFKQVYNSCNYHLLRAAASASGSVSAAAAVDHSSKPHRQQRLFACCCFTHISLVQGSGKILLGNRQLGSKSSRHRRCDCCSSSANDGFEESQLGKGFNLEQEMEKVLEDEESQALLKDLAAATERVSAARRELDLIFEQEKRLAELKARLEHLDATQTEANELVANCERDFAAAELEVAAAELSLVTARAGDSLQAFTNTAKTEAVDNNFERIESIRAAAVSALGGVSASLPFAIASGQGLDLNFFLSEGSILVSCALFGVCFRYIVRRDLDNIQLKAGAAAAFGLVRGLGQLETTQLLVDCSKGGCHEVFEAALDAGQSLYIFFSAALVLDFCLKKKLLKPFSAEKSQKQ